MWSGSQCYSFLLLFAQLLIIFVCRHSYSPSVCSAVSEKHLSPNSPSAGMFVVTDKYLNAALKQHVNVPNFSLTHGEFF